ncbi:hypothetical protein [Spongiivirga citrea]|uniref:Uncharacterized protein n=1 Tax=Spongiivirga citrea TaxID=1481457 RepID=A0A6M0CL99_9FLAO|nr:hypothetical protein [Spongiivirga citrea]NER18698.1 hypothetical protein [Spongiivirga citrea]
MKTKHTQIKKSLIVVIGLLFMLPTAILNAQDCRVVEAIGNGTKELILRQLNDKTRGEVYKISRRKKLIINKVETIGFKGCRVTVVAHVTLKRKIRRDAKGRVTISGTVSEFNRNRICFNNTKVDKIRLSNTFRIGEGFYKWIANKVLPNNRCYSVR